MDIFLDIETDCSRQLTIVGIQRGDEDLVQLVGQEITAARLRSEVPKSGRLVTYNGHSFDLSVIREQLGLDLRGRQESLDLRWVCQRHRIMGGQKAVERQLGISRETDGLDGWDAVRLWQEYLDGRKKSLATLLAYNRDDVQGIAAILGRLKDRRLI